MFATTVLTGLVAAGIADRGDVLTPELESQVNLDSVNFVTNDHLKDVLAGTDATPEQVDAAVEVNEESRLRALQISLLALAAVAAVAIVPAGRMPGFTPGDIPEELSTPAAPCPTRPDAASGRSAGMTYPIIVTAAVLVLAVAAFIWGRLPVAIVAIGVALALYATSGLSAEQALAGFGDPVIVFIASMFVVSEGLDATGVTTWPGNGSCAPRVRARSGCSCSSCCW